MKELKKKTPLPESDSELYERPQLVGKFSATLCG
jgi:hypothetical protein